MDHSATQITCFITIFPKYLQKTPKLAIFGNFDPINPKSGKNEMAYLIGYFAGKPKIYTLLYTKCDFYVIMTAENVIFANLRAKRLKMAFFRPSQLHKIKNRVQNLYIFGFPAISPII